MNASTQHQNTDAAATPLLQLKNISKTFPGVKALQNVDFDVRKGEVHGLCGENGAGKSTLMKILTGIYTADPGGEIWIDGKQVDVKGVNHARELGLSIIHQELNMVPDLTVAQNLFLGRPGSARGGFVNDARMTKDAGDLFDRLGMRIDPRSYIRDLSVARQQMVEIARALSYDSRILVMDEPTDTKLDLAIERGVPIVCVDRRAPRYALDAVVVDNVRSARLATEGLFEAGFDRVACVTGPENVETARLRLAGWRQAYQEAGRPAPEELVRHVPYTVNGGETGVTDLLALPEPPDAIFAANNKLAAGVIRVLFERGLESGQIGVTSLGGLPLVTWQPRGIQVWHLPARDLGTEAAKVLLERIQGETTPPRTIVLDTLTSDDQDGYDRID